MCGRGSEDAGPCRGAGGDPECSALGRVGVDPGGWAEQMDGGPGSSRGSGGTVRRVKEWEGGL